MRGRGKDDLRWGGMWNSDGIVYFHGSGFPTESDSTGAGEVRCQHLHRRHPATVSPAVIWISNISRESVVATAG